MKILIISQYYWPEPISKPYELAESLQQRGHQVTVLTGFPNYPRGDLYPGYSLRPYKVEHIKGVRVIRLPLYLEHSRSAMLRVLNYGSFALSASLLGPWLVGKIDAIYAWHPPLTVGIPAFLISWLRGAPLLYGVHDLWPESVVASGVVQESWFTSLLRGLERFTYSRTRAIGVVAPRFIDNLVGKGVAREKIHLLPDWADEDIYRPMEPDSNLAKETGMDGKFNVVFGGQIGIAQDLGTVLKAAQLLKEDHGVQFVLAGDGIDKPRLEALAKNQGLENVRFLGRLPPEEVRRIYALADALLVNLQSGFFSSISIPSKTYAYMACGKPILMALDGSAAEFIDTVGAGVTCAPGDPVQMVEAIRKLQRMTPVRREEMGSAGRKAFLKHYSRDVGVTVHERVLTAMCLANEKQAGTTA